MNRVFCGCHNLKTINLSRIDTSKVTNMGNLFNNCRQLTNLDLLNFDTSNLIDCNNIFSLCQSLKTLELTNFITSKLENVEAMFDGCQKLTSLDLTNFDTSKITTMKQLFRNCDSLVYLNISNFNTSSVTNMDRMFSHCSSLASLDLTHFDTSKVTDMYKMICDCFILNELKISNFNTSNVKNMSYMFSNNKELTSLDLSSFTMESAINIIYMFNNTPKLEYINLINANPNKNIKINNIFKGTSQNLVICTESQIISQQINISNCSTISCSENWRENQKKINPDNNQCVDNCSILNNKYDYLSKCIDECPDLLYTFEYLSKCVDICPSSTYLADNKCKRCHPDCKTCDGPYNDTNSNCTSCISLDKYLKNGNRIFKNKNKNKNINIPFLYNTTNNTKIYNIVKEYILASFELENDFEIISEATDNVVFQITTQKNQLKTLTDSSLNKNNLSIIDIGDCEKILKEKYNLNENDDLIVLKKEKKSNKPSEKEVQLEIYEPYNKTKLNLSLCQNININIYVKAELSDEIKYTYEKLKSLGYDMFNINDPFYQDICTDYTSFGNTDVILSDRINYIYNNEDTQCQPNCKLSKYSLESEYLNCSCSVDEEVNNMNEKFKSEKIYESFFDVLKYSNYKVLKCYNLVFTKYLMTKSIGGILVFSFILIYLGCFIFFIIKGINPLKDKLELKIENEYKIKNLNNIDQNNIIISSKVDVYKISQETNKYLNAPPRRGSTNQILNNKILINIVENNINSIYGINSKNQNTKIKKIRKRNKAKTVANQQVN